MSKAGKAAIRGMMNAIEYAQGDKSKGKETVVMVPAVDVKAARKKLGYTQDAFAKAFHINLWTLRNWEQGKRQPDGPARALLFLINREPEAVKRAFE